MHPGLKFARVARTYDQKRKLTTEAFYGPDGKPVAIGDGYARRARKYDDRGNLLDEAF